MKKLVLCIILSGLCMTNSYASDSDYINWLRQELNDRNAAILKMQNTISRQDQAIRNLEGQLSGLEMLFDAVLDSNYSENQMNLHVQQELCQYRAPLNTREKVLCTELDSILGELERKVLDAPNEVQILYMDAMRKKVAGNFKEALVDFQELITKHNDSALTPYAYYEMGEIYYRMGKYGPMKDKEKNYAKAKENFLSALSVTKFKDSYVRANFNYRLGQISLEQKDPVRAKKYFTLVAQHYPQDISALETSAMAKLALIAKLKLEIIKSKSFPHRKHTKN